MERKLAAILAADVVGYSRLMERDEAATFERLRKLRKDVFEPEIGQHHGHIFKLMGDGLLAEFDSVVDAVTGAVVLQQRMCEHNAGVAQDQRIDVRIGINLGDVIMEGSDRHGDSVNIAARLQELADPGGIAVSQTVVSHVKNKLGLHFESLGEHRVKNINEPVWIYRVVTDGIAAHPSRPFGRLGVIARRSMVAATLGLILLMAAGGGLAWHFYSHPEAPGGPPSIVVLPFANMSGEPALDYFSDGVTEDITMALSTFPEIRVVARTSASAYKGKAVKVQEVGRDLGVQYVLEGSTQKTAGKARIIAQLIDARTGNHVWASRFDEEGDNIIALQDTVAARVFNALAGFKGEIRKSEEQAAWGKDGIALGEYDYYLRGHQIFFKYTEKDMAEARRVWREGLASFPNSALLRIKIAVSHLQDAAWGWSDHPDRDLDEGWKLLEEAAAIPNRPRLVEWYLHYIRTPFLQWRNHDFGASVSEARAAFAIMPFDSWSLADLGGQLAQAGKTDEAIERIEDAIRRDPHPPDWYIGNLGWAHYLAGDYTNALKVLETMNDPHNLALIATLVRGDRIDEAQRLMTEYAALYPHDTIDLWRRVPIWDEAVKQGWIDDLRKASDPDQRN
ncbi:MAG: adenylate/guanylate cyclase domain-containing protein [Rhodospirillum sp.]|nr:adenylate/guanylate cyclase domain-containing protein [Rhodospirillum sp.]